MLGRPIQWPPPSFDDWSLGLPPTLMNGLPPPYLDKQSHPSFNKQPPLLMNDLLFSYEDAA